MTSSWMLSRSAHCGSSFSSFSSSSFSWASDPRVPWYFAEAVSLKTRAFLSVVVSGVSGILPWRVIPLLSRLLSPAPACCHVLRGPKRQRAIIPNARKDWHFLRLLLVTGFEHSFVVYGVVGAGAKVVAVVEGKAAETSVKGKRGGICASSERIGLCGTRVGIRDENTLLRKPWVLLTTIVPRSSEEDIWLESMRRVSRLSG